jgi:hypothetical protein
VQLARALTAAGSLQEARREFEALRSRADVPQNVRVAALGNIEAIDAALKERENAERQERVQVAQAGPRTSESDAAAIAAAMQLIREGRAADAQVRLERLAPRPSGNPDFDYVYGVALLDAGRPAQAVGALRRAINARPDFQVARAELGRALAAMGDLAGARRELDAVRAAGGIPAEARDALTRQVLVIDQALAAQTGPRLTGYIETSVGYDTNVNSGPASDQLVIPALAFLGPATILPSTMPKKAGFAEIAGALNYAHPIGTDGAFFANLAGSFRPLFRHDEFDTGLVGGEVGFARQIGQRDVFSVAAIGQAFWTGGDLLRTIYGAAGQWRREVDGWNGILSATWLGLEYPSGAGVNADRYTATATLLRRFDAMPLTPLMSVSASAGKEIARDGASDFMSFLLWGLRAHLETTITPAVSAFVQAGYEFHRHDDDYPMFMQRREDQLFEVTGGLDIKLNEKAHLRPAVRWSQTRSNVDIFDTERWIGWIAMRWIY